MPNYHRWVDRMQMIERRIRPSSVYLLLLVLVAFAIGGLSMSLWFDQNQPKKQSNTEEIDKWAKQLNAQTQVLASKSLELVLERESGDKMQQMFAEQHHKQRELERELRFYRSIMAPENSADGVSIEAVELTPSLLPRQYRLQLILTQLQKRKQSLKGKSSITLVGVQQGKVVELDVATLLDNKALFDFDFRYFQILDAEITLPEDFELSRVKAKVKVPSSRWTKGSEAEVEYNVEQLLPEYAREGQFAEDLAVKEALNKTLRDIDSTSEVTLEGSILDGNSVDSKVINDDLLSGSANEP
ncbi:MAG: hypothetical protein ACI90A_001250 [Shewanella sp.]|jgi:hypothetical protein